MRAFFGGMVVVGALLLVFVGGVRGCNARQAAAQAERDRKNAEAKAAAQAAPAATGSTLELRHECIMPCSFRIDFRAQFWGDGTPIAVTHPGVSEPVLYPPGVERDAPAGVLVGETFFVSADPARLNARVKIFEKKGNWP